MREHHRRTIEHLVRNHGSRPENLALIVGGSVAKGLELESSDVDVMLIVTEDEYRRRREREQLQFLERESCDYDGGYVDFKTYNLAFLRDVAARGSETARWAFDRAILAWTRDAQVDALLRGIPVYPIAEKRERIGAFYSQLFISRWYLQEAEKRSDPYLLRWASDNLVLFSGRLILAHNEMLFPYHKWFMHELRRAVKKPDSFLPCAEAVLKCPCLSCGEALYTSVNTFENWGFTPRFCVDQFLENTELAWQTGRLPPEYW